MDQVTQTNEIEAQNETQDAPVSAKDILARTSVSPPNSQGLNDAPTAVKLDDIKDPAARSLMEKRLKELESGYNKKYEDLANKRKELESSMNQPRAWTQEELDHALTDPNFISLVQARQQQASANQPPVDFDGSVDEWSALTPQEKQTFAQLNQRVSAQEQMMSQMLKTEEDTKLKASYPDYDPKVVDRIQQDLMNGRLQATREHLWKVVNFESAVERAYRLGKEDRKLELTDKLNASSTIATHNVTPAGEVPAEVKAKGFGAIGRWRLEQAKSGKK